MMPVLKTRIGCAFRHLAPPLVCYYTVTLVLPLANGAAEAHSTFGKHALIVLVVPAAAIVAACVLFTTARRVFSTCRAAWIQDTRRQARDR